jgi:hypothetical protein
MMFGCSANDGNKTDAKPAQKIVDKFNAMTTAEHLKFAKEAIESHHLAPAKLHLEAIPAGAVEHKEAKELILQIKTLNAKAIKHQEEQAALNKRVSFALDLQDKLNQMGIKSTISAKSKSKTTLYVNAKNDYDREIIFKLINEEIRDTMVYIGYKNVILTNGGSFKYNMKL